MHYCDQEVSGIFNLKYIDIRNLLKNVIRYLCIWQHSVLDFILPSETKSV